MELRNEIGKGLMMSELVFKNQAASEAMIDAWTAIFTHAEIRAEDVGRGFADVLKSSKFFPKPSEVIAAIQGDSDQLAEIAWERARQLLREHGGDASFTLNDFEGDGQALYAFAECLDRMRLMTADERNLVAAEFRRIYRVAKSQGYSCSRIVGTFERANAALGLDHREHPCLAGRPDVSPARIGQLMASDPPKELIWLESSQRNWTGNGRERFLEAAKKLGIGGEPE